MLHWIPLLILRKPSLLQERLVLHELEMLLENGLIKSGDLNNAIVYVDKPLSESNMERLKEAFGKDNIAVQPNGILDNLSLHFSNEAARHKLLDVIGDLALVGVPIRGRFLLINLVIR